MNKANLAGASALALMTALALTGCGGGGGGGGSSSGGTGTGTGTGTGGGGGTPLCTPNNTPIPATDGSGPTNGYVLATPDGKTIYPQTQAPFLNSSSNLTFYYNVPDAAPNKPTLMMTTILDYIPKKTDLQYIEVNNVRFPECQLEPGITVNGHVLQVDFSKVSGVTIPDMTPGSAFTVDAVVNTTSGGNTGILFQATDTSMPGPNHFHLSSAIPPNDYGNHFSFRLDNRLQ